MTPKEIALANARRDARIARKEAEKQRALASETDKTVQEYRRLYWAIETAKKRGEPKILRLESCAARFEVEQMIAWARQDGHAELAAVLEKSLTEKLQELDQQGYL